jgi:uncharacterized MAPEG superfamily protein
MTQPLPAEIVMLGLGAVLLLLQMFLQSVSSAIELGGGYKAGPRDDTRVVRSVMRILYVPLYLIQIPFARSVVWFASIFALVAMLVRLFQ